MDLEDLRSKGVFGIIAFSIRLIHYHRRRFLSLAATTLLPPSALSLAGLLIAPSTSPRPDQYIVSNLLITLIYSVIHLFVLLLAAGAAIHLIASTYVAKDSASLSESVLQFVPRAWPRLLGTSVWNFLLYLVCTLFGTIIIGLTVGLAMGTASQENVVLCALATITVCVASVVFVAGSLYVGVICDLAIAATVLEGTGTDGSSSSACWGVAALKKARTLVRGKVIMCCSLVLLFLVPSFGIAFCWAKTLAAQSIPLAGRVAAGVVILFAQTGLLLLGTTLLAVTYLVLKAWHGEKVDSVSLTSGLDPSSDLYERMVV